VKVALGMCAVVLAVGGIAGCAPDDQGSEYGCTTAGRKDTSGGVGR
jgi:hypothetical protein